MLILGVGLVVLGTGLGGWSIDRDLSARGVRTTAVVVEVQSGWDFSYVVRLDLPDGRSVTERTSYADVGADVGDTIDVEYDPEDASTVAQVGARSAAWILWGGWTLTGVVTVIAGLVRYSRRRRLRG